MDENDPFIELTVLKGSYTVLWISTSLDSLNTVEF